MSIQGQLLEVTVVGCSKLKDTEWISRQDPYVCLEYATIKFRTRTCTDGGRHPTFQEKIVIPLIEGLREIGVAVWNSNTLKFDDFIGSSRIQLNKVLSQGFDDSSWSLQSKSGKYAGEVKLIMHFVGAHLQQQHGHKSQKVQESNYPASSQPLYMPMAALPASSYALPGSSLAPPPVYPSTDAYSAGAPAPYPTAYPPNPYPPPTAYPPAAYLPQPYPPAPANPYYPPGAYPPPSY